MASIRGSRLPVGSASWISEERSAALQIAEDEAEEFSYSARNELEWLNEHMTGIFDENEINVAEMFKTPGKLRGKTPRAVRKQETTEARVPLSDIFAGTPRGVDESNDDEGSHTDNSSPVRPAIRKSSLNFATLPAREPLTTGKSLGGRMSRTSHLDLQRASYYDRPMGGKSLGGNTVVYPSDGDDDEMDVDEDEKTRLQDRIGMLGQSQAKPSRPSKSIANLAPISTVATPVSPQRPEQKMSTVESAPAVPPKDAAPITATTKGSSDGGHADFVLPKQRQANSRPNSPYKAPIIPDRTTSTLPHMKSASPISVSNPTLATVSESSRPPSPMKSPSRTLRDSPLKQVKNKLSSILKSSKGLLASSAAISAEGKSSILSPSTTRLGYFTGASSESIAQPNLGESMYPDLSKALADAQSASSLTSPTKANGRRTRASAERERKEKMVEKETRRLADQMGKLEKEREKEREKARVFSKEQERIAAMEKQMTTQKEVEKKRPAEKEIAKPTRSSPRRAKPQDQDPASLPRPAGPGPAIRNRELKRPARPAKDAVPKSKAAPMVIKVNMGPHHSQYHPSNNALSANLHESLVAAVPQPQLSSKPSQSKLKSKSSVQSLKSSVSSSGRPKALELAAKRKEQEEREAQRKREARAELERKRAAQQEEDRRIEAEKKMAKEREAEAKKAAQRQAAIEKAKQTRAPPPAVRAQPNGPPEYVAPPEQQQQQQPQAVSRPPSRLGSSVFRSQEDLNRPVNTLLSNANKSQKRPLGQDNDGGNARAAPARSGPTYQGQDAKRRRTSQEFEEDKDVKTVSNIKGPPVRPSAGYKKVEAPTKPVFNNGYSAAPTGASRDLFKTTVTSQHNSAMKAAHPLDMAQFSKGAIPFAPNPGQAGTAYKTPARQGQVANVKSTAKSGPRTSPRFPNGDSIELPEIDTDDEDEDSDADQGMVASWADSPDLRRALLRQETMDPSHIFGPPAPLNMEEVFNKSKDRWHKFRARTSSANWSGADRLTEDDIRKDLAARDRLRREGAWTYELSKDMA
ncbi:unnamed protein product [Parascedosporium putredinis]|uniref:Inner centromere protein ARK-binding domain-containing protein n=1 Tax=Parascedosporium putredinis TaxID=1442378 RepID=A0A9P1GUB4_9PEZI|nr:unnamed protein product [Parascedosporium putredinis]CAI7987787.1 unnamed protein product [Parascedosporium putredinis]